MHNKSKNTNYSNKDINKEHSRLNYSIKAPYSTYEKIFRDTKEKYNLQGMIKKVSNVMCEFIITSEKEFFNSIGEEETKHYEQEKITNDIEIMRNDYKRVIKKFNTLTKRYSKIKNIVDKTMYKTEQIQLENYNLKQKNEKLKQENIHLKDYIDKTFEYVSILFDLSKDTLKRLVNSFINRINLKNR